MTTPCSNIITEDEWMEAEYSRAAFSFSRDQPAPTGSTDFQFAPGYTASGHDSASGVAACAESASDHPKVSIAPTDRRYRVKGLIERTSIAVWSSIVSIPKT